MKASVTRRSEAIYIGPNWTIVEDPDDAVMVKVISPDGSVKFGYPADDSELSEFGGEGSGNHGHAGRPGQVGGSAPDNNSSEGIRTLPKGSKIGTKKAIDEWAKNSVFKSEMYHYSIRRESIMKEGFDPKSHYQNHGDGIYFAYDKEISRDYGEGSDPISVRINVNANQYADFEDPSPNFLSDMDEWDEMGNEELAEPGTIGQFCEYYGYKVWNDGIQIGVVDSSAIGIISDENELSMAELGGPGSGNHGHAGRPGKVGGSAPDSVSSYPKANPNGRDTMEQFMNADGTWTKERQQLHEKIIAKFFEGKTPVDNPTSFLMGGGPAAGKTTMLRSGTIKVPDNYVLAAGDDIKELLPEYDEGVKAGNAIISAFVHEESSYLSKQIAKRAAEQNYNVLMDGTGDSGINSLKKKIDSMRPNGQPVIGMYATIDIETAKFRSLERAKKTGRYMPESVLVANHQAISRIFPSIVENDVMDQVNLFDTSYSPPKLIAVGAAGKLTVHDDGAYQRFLDKAK